MFGHDDSDEIMHLTDKDKKKLDEMIKENEEKCRVSIERKMIQEKIDKEEYKNWLDLAEKYNKENNEKLSI